MGNGRWKRDDGKRGGERAKNGGERREQNKNKGKGELGG